MAYFQMKWTQSDGANPFNNGDNALTHTFDSSTQTPPLLVQIYPPPLPPLTITFSSPTAAMSFFWTNIFISTNYYYSIYVLENFAYNPVPLVSPILLVSGRILASSITSQIPHIYMNINIRCNIYYEILGGAKSPTYTINNAIWLSIPDTPVITANVITYGLTNSDADTLITTWTSIGGAKYKIALFNTDNSIIGDWSSFYETISVNPLNLPFSQSSPSPKSFYTKIKAYPNTNYFDQEDPDSRSSMSAASATLTWYKTSLPNPVASLPTLTITPQGGPPNYTAPTASFTWNASTGNDAPSKATFYTWTFYVTVTFDVYAPLGQSPATYTGITYSSATSGTITETFTFPTPDTSLGPVDLYVRMTAGNRAGPGDTLSPNADEFTVAPYIASYTFLAPCPNPTNIYISACTPNSITMNYDGKNGLYDFTYNYILYKIVSGVTTQVTSGTNTGQGNFSGAQTDTVDISSFGVAHNNLVYFTQKITRSGSPDSQLVTSANFTVS
jgi:hypothetical protein